MPSNLNLIKIKPLRGTALLVFNPTLVYSIVDSFFGGTGKSYTKIEGRDFTGTEMKVIKTVMLKLFDDLKKAWGPIMDVDFEHIGSEVNPHFANIVSPSEVVVISTFHVELDNGGGDIHMTLPYSMIEPIREQLHAGIQSDTAERDERWGQSLRESLKMAPLVLKSRLTTLDMNLRDLKAMKVGDVIPFDFPETVSATIEGVPVLKASYGMSRGNNALKVTEVLNTEGA
jgi:flagellar motor switch protein FliM